MKPSIKAKQLIIKFSNVAYINTNGAKVCALLCVDEIIEEIREFDNMDGYAQSRIDYFQEVKNQITQM